MLVYRALLIDTERFYERPVQSYFSCLSQAKDWAAKALARAGGKAYVQLYRSNESECGIVNQPVKELPDDTIPAPRIQSAKA